MYILYIYIYIYIYIYLYKYKYNKAFLPTYSWLTLQASIAQKITQKYSRKCKIFISRVNKAMSSCTLLQFEPVTINI